MSIMHQMKRAINNADASTEEYLNQMYLSVKKEIFNNVKKRDDIHALRLESFLNQIKYMQKVSSGQGDMSAFPFQSFWKKADQLALMTKLQEIKPELFTDANFLQMPDTSYELGAQLEIGLARVVKSMESIATGKTYQESSKSIVGGAHTQIPNLINETDKIIKNEFNNMYSKVQEELHKYNQETDYNIGTYVHSVQGKIDNVGLSGEIIISAELTNMEKDVINALKNATFTAKNYISTTELKFGQTNPFRVFATVAPTKGKESVGRFERMINCFESHSSVLHTEGPKMFYRIRAMYELTGAKMVYTNSSREKLGDVISNIIVGKPAKYLIWNNPLGGIRVIPTAKIVDELIISSTELLPSNWKDAVYGKITFPQENLSSL